MQFVICICMPANSVAIKTVPKCLVLTYKIAFYYSGLEDSLSGCRYLNIMWNIQQTLVWTVSIAWKFSSFTVHR